MSRCNFTIESYNVTMGMGEIVRFNYKCKDCGKTRTKLVRPPSVNDCEGLEVVA